MALKLCIFSHGIGFEMRKTEFNIKNLINRRKIK